MDDTEYEYDYTEQAQLLGLREKYTNLWVHSFVTREWEKMKFYDRLLVEIDEKLETL